MDLILEEPQNMRFRIYNLSPSNMNIKLSFRDTEQSDIKILSIENGTENLGFIKPNDCKEFTLRLFALKCGLNQLNGLIIRDLSSSKDILFQNFAQLYVKYE